MNTISVARSARWKTLLASTLVLGAASAAAAIVFWPPATAVAQRWWTQLAALAALPQAPAEEDHDHDHPPAKHDPDSLDLSRQARQSMGLTYGKIGLSDFTKTISVPGIVVVRPGRSQVAVTAPFAGIVTRIHRLEGEAVEPGQPLFDLRLTHEDLVATQAEFLQTLESLSVVKREIERIEKLSADGALAGKLLLERQYERQKLDAALRSQRQALLLHGLSESQIDDIVVSRQLFQNLTITAPALDNDGRMTPQPPSPTGDEQAPTAKEPSAAEPQPVFQIQRLQAAPGQHVDSGAMLALLSDHAELFVQGEAFERDIPALSRAVAAQAPLQVRFEAEPGGAPLLKELSLLYLAPEVSAESRTLHFYAVLPNERVRDTTENQRRFVEWRFRPGQRALLQVPVETLAQRIVLPAAAVAQDGAEHYVFVLNGDHFERRAVVIEYRDAHAAVLPAGALSKGVKVATSSAQQLLLALKNQSGGAIDPHAGHTH